jgi:hypothetical protein
MPNISLSVSINYFRLQPLSGNVDQHLSHLDYSSSFSGPDINDFTIGLRRFQE